MSEQTGGTTPTLDIQGRIATITLRRPAVANRLEIEDLLTLRTQIEQVNASSDVLVLRLTALGKHFCSGFNIGRLEQGAAPGPMFEALAGAIEQARPVTVAALRGGVYGGGTDLALACDFRIGTSQSEMVVPAARLGLLFYRGGMERFVTRLGLGNAKRIMLCAEKLDAAAMLECNYLDRVIDNPDELQANVDALSQSLAAMAPLALLGMKKHLNRIAAGTLDAQQLAEDIRVADASADVQEGARAWKEKRPAMFLGC